MSTKETFKNVCDNCWPLPSSGYVKLCALHSSAPELLEALGNLLSFCEKAHHDNTILTEARNAIKKAEGRS